MYSLWKDFAGRDNERIERIVEWNSRAHEEQDKKIRRRVTIEQEALLRQGIDGKVFAKNYARRWHTLRFVALDNKKSCCENTQKELKEE